MSLVLLFPWLNDAAPATVIEPCPCVEVSALPMPSVRLRVARPAASVNVLPMPSVTVRVPKQPRVTVTACECDE